MIGNNTNRQCTENSDKSLQNAYHVSVLNTHTHNARAIKYSSIMHRIQMRKLRAKSRFHLISLSKAQKEYNGTALNCVPVSNLLTGKPSKPTVKDKAT